MLNVLYRKVVIDLLINNYPEWEYIHYFVYRGKDFHDRIQTKMHRKISKKACGNKIISRLRNKFDYAFITAWERYCRDVRSYGYDYFRDCYFQSLDDSLYFFCWLNRWSFLSTLCKVYTREFWSLISELVNRDTSNIFVDKVAVEVMNSDYDFLIEEKA